jgi:2-polyprenyl-3-methyl-5-hydroxy-6-metoxy-1,4-benzoquinol methylase
MVIGSILSGFDNLELSTADNKRFTLKNNAASRLALRTIGLPHLGFRRRAAVILKQARGIARPDSKVLDAGCGYGLYSLSLASLGLGQIDAVDVDAGRIAALEKMFAEQPELKKRIHLKVGSLTKLPFADASYDIIICSEVIEHIADHESAVRELSRVLKPGGTLLLSVPTDSDFNRRTYRRFDHQRPGYTKSMLATMLAPYNISITKDFYYEFAPGARIFNTFNAISSKALMGILFYPFYFLFWLDSKIKVGQPNYTIIVAKKS